MVIAKTFLKHSRLKGFHRLRLICLEERPDRRESLDNRLASLPKVPCLDVMVPPAGTVRAYFRRLHKVAHGGDPQTPVLWILDPFDISSVPFDLVRACLNSPRDEVLVTWFADELYRFRGDMTKEHAIDLHFGTDAWQQTRQVTGEARCKAELLKVSIQPIHAW